MGEMRNSRKILLGEPEYKRTFGKSELRFEDNIKMNLTIIRYEGVVWIHLVKDRDQ
jgi:hypothetical protein